MGILIGFTVVVVAGCVGLLWYLLRQERIEQRQSSRHVRGQKLASELNQMKRDSAALIPALYQGDVLSQRAVGVSVNLALAFFRSVYPSAESFAMVSVKEQREFVRKLGEAEQLFHDRDKAEAGAALTILKCWLTALGAGDAKYAAEMKQHLDYFSQKPLEEYSEPIVTPTSQQWASP